MWGRVLERGVREIRMWKHRDRIHKHLAVQHHLLEFDDSSSVAQYLMLVRL